MPKRKHDELSAPPRPRASDTRKLSIHGTRLTQMYENGVQMISRGLKISRGFERQKLSRREKTAKSQKDDKALARLKEEIEILKGLDYQTVSERYLFKQLVRTKRIAETRTFGEFQGVKKVSQEGPKSTAEANILARLFKSTPVQKEIPGIMAGIRKLLKVDEAPAAKKDGDKKESAAKKKSAKAKDDSESESETTTKRQRGEQVSRADDMEISGSDESGDELSQFDARLAPGSDSEADSESGDEDEDADDISDSISRSPSPAFSGADSPPPKKAKATKGSAAPAQNTTFLPSLMAGGYWSGSEEATDEEAEAQPKRKNRMGQQARRALWEKKFGAGANHVKHEQMQEKMAAKYGYGSRDNGWDAKRGATEGPRGRGGKRGAFGGSGRFNKHDGSGHAGDSKPGKPGKPKGPPQDEGPLHPSWEAKRKAKEQAPAAFSGKKVTFD
ncbi:unnamed protein product [Penicillium olsonii]|uniref:Bud22 domain-containing protein n=1 Tax=Penicillium olsonii TaxID=99116 RepID=A0A9W4HSW0_PENOL|nr:unnamed protein product [Penicillium olsonii]CAG8144847.1 unnamed protein product [Penicillium olsonii]